VTRRRTTDLDALLDVAEQLATVGDPEGLTLRRLATEARVSNGSIYHLFSSKDELLARVWIRAAHRLLAEQKTRVDQAVGNASSEADADDAVVVAALWPIEYAIEHPTTARLFFGQRRDQLFSPMNLPSEITDELAAIQKMFTGVLLTLSRARWKRADRAAVEAIAVCVVDLPGGLMQRRLATGEGVGPQLLTQVEVACRALLTLEPPSAHQKSRTTQEKKET
jgi:AcrR family transcriptional regulator